MLENSDLIRTFPEKVVGIHSNYLPVSKVQKPICPLGNTTIFKETNIFRLYYSYVGKLWSQWQNSSNQSCLLWLSTLEFELQLFVVWKKSIVDPSWYRCWRQRHCPRTGSGWCSGTGRRCLRTLCSPPPPSNRLRNSPSSGLLRIKWYVEVWLWIQRELK